MDKISEDCNQAFKTYVLDKEFQVKVIKRYFDGNSLHENYFNEVQLIK